MLERLVLEAKELQQRGISNHEIAQALREEATKTYGNECRDKEFVDVLKLALAIDQKEVRNWDVNYDTIATGKFPEMEPGEFRLNEYAVGKVDISLDDRVVNRIHALAMSIVYHVKPYNFNCFDFKEKGNYRKKKERSLRLAKILGDKLPRSHITTIIQEAVVPYEDRFLFENLDGFHFQIDLGNEEIAKRSIEGYREQLGTLIGQIKDNIRYTNAVIDGSRHYKR